MQKSSFIFPTAVGLSFSGFLATDIYLPSFPRMVEYFQTSSGGIQFSLSIFVFTMAFSQFIFGLLSDKYGRRPMLLVGIIIYTIGCLFLFNTSSIAWLYLGRSLQGFGIGSAVAISRIILRDIYRGSQLAKMFSIVAMVIVIAPAVSPYFGGIIQTHFDFYGNYVVMLACGLILLGMVQWMLPETNQHLDPNAARLKQVTHQLKNYLHNRTFSFACLTNGAVFSMFLSYTAISPFIFKHSYQVDSMITGELLLFMASGLVVGMFLNNVLLKYYQPTQNIYIGLMITLLVNSLLLAVNILVGIKLALFVGLLFCLNLGIALILPNIAAIVFSIFPSGTGLVGAVYGALRMLTVALVGMVISALHLVTISQLSLLLVILNMVALVSYVYPSYFKNAHYSHLEVREG